MAIVGIYGLFYAAVTTILMPWDTTTLEMELSTVQIPVNNASTIAEMESAAVDTESSSSLSYVSKSERMEVANTMRIVNTPPPGFFDQMKEYKELNNFRMLAYTLIFRGDISNQIKNISSTHEEISRLDNETESLNQKLYTDMEKGNSKGYAEDLKNIADNLKQQNTAMETLKNQLESLIHMLKP